MAKKAVVGMEPTQDDIGRAQLEQVETAARVTRDISESEERQHLEELGRQVKSYRDNRDKVFASATDSKPRARVVNYGTNGKGFVSLITNENGLLKIATPELEEFFRIQEAAFENEINPGTLREQAEDALREIRGTAKDVAKKISRTTGLLNKRAKKFLGIPDIHLEETGDDEEPANVRANAVGPAIAQSGEVLMAATEKAPSLVHLLESLRNEAADFRLLETAFDESLGGANNQLDDVMEAKRGEAIEKAGGDAKLDPQELGRLRAAENARKELNRLLEELDGEAA